MSVFQETRALLRTAEMLVIGKSFNPAGRLASDLIDGVLHVPWFVMAGTQGLVTLAVRGVFLAGAWLILLRGIAYLTSAGTTPSLASLLWTAVLFGFGSVVLDLPSGLLNRRIREAHVSKLAAHIVSRDGDIELLRQGVAIASATSSRRLSFVGWVLGLAWALMTWSAAQWVFAPDVSDSVRDGAISYGVVFVVAFLFLGAAFASYREAHRALNETVSFALLEAGAQEKRGQVHLPVKNGVRFT